MGLNWIKGLIGVALVCQLRFKIRLKVSGFHLEIFNKRLFLIGFKKIL